MRGSLALVGLVGILLVGCVTAPPTGVPSLVFLPPFVSAKIPRGTEIGTSVVEALGRAVSGRFSLRTRGLFDGRYGAVLGASTYGRTALATEADLRAAAEALKVEAVGLVDVVPGDDPDNIVVHYRIVEASSVLVLVRGSQVVPGDGRTMGAWAVQKWLARAQSVPLGTGFVAVPDWDAGLDQALRSGDFDEALRLVDLIADRDQTPSTFRQAVLQEAQKAREAQDTGALMALLARPQGTAREEALALHRFLDLVRQTAARSDAGLRPPVVEGFRARFGRDLAGMLAQPALALVAGGTFFMGHTQGEPDEAPLHSVTVSDFLMARTEVTQDQYAGLTGTNPSLFLQASDAPRRPVERVTWYDALEFCNRLSLKEGLVPVYTLTKRNPATGYPIKAADVVMDRTKSGYRLPTEAEWEWAARGGTMGTATVLSGSDDPKLVAWTDGTSGGPGPVAELDPNALGLYDMSGNVWEWCSDWYGRYTAGPQTDPEGPSLGILKVGRGGSWHAAAWNSRVTARSFDNPGSRGNNLGFRVVRTLGAP